MNKTLKERAIELYQNELDKENERCVASQRRFVTKLVGEDGMKEVHYDTINNEWIIDGKKFQCWTKASEFCYGPSRVPALSLRDGPFQNAYIYSLTDLGRILKQEEDRVKANKQNEISQNISIPTTKPSWFLELSRLFDKVRNK